ncbi:MAG: hypothetical protein Q7R79_04400, partial [bacterium]|nr:hypothetical protein [bacterium]
GISCGAGCLASFPNGTEVTVTVSPDAGWYITGITTNATFTQNGNICRQAFEIDILRNGGFTGTFSCPVLMEKNTTFSVNLIQR